MIALVLAALAAPAYAAEALSPTPVIVTTYSSAPVAGVSVSLLKDRFIEATDPAVKGKALVQLSKTRPVSGQDVAALFDMFSRYPDKAVREGVMASLSLVSQDSPQLEPLFLSYLRQPESEAKLFGINGAFRLRSRAALPMIHELADKKLAAATLSDTSMLSERNQWWTQFEALSALAQWEGEKVLPLLERRAEESPAVGRLLGRYFWAKTLPKLKAWDASTDLNVRDRARQAASAMIENPAEARATREQMLALLKDVKLEHEIRHQLALKIGVSSTDEEVEKLIAEHDAAASDSERLYWASAVFVSRSPKAVPLLARYAALNGDEIIRRGAQEVLVSLVGDEKAKSLVEEEKKKHK